MKKILLTLLLVTALVFTACGGNDAPGTGETTPEETTGTETESESESAEIVPGQYLNTYLVSEPTTLDPSKGADTYSNSILTNILEPLVRLEENEDGSVEVTPAGAENYEVSEDGLTHTFTIRAGNKWHDGQEVTAEDYAYGIKRSLNPETGSPYSFLLTMIKNAPAVLDGTMGVDDLGVTVDGNKLIVELERMTPYFSQIAYQRVMMPQRADLVEQHGQAYGAEPQFSNGPYKIDSWTHNAEIILSKNENYWDAANVQLEKVTLKIIQDENTIYNAFDVGEIDNVGSNRPEWRERFEAKDNVTHKAIVNPQTFFLFFNTQDEVFKNDKVRLAFSSAIDREDLANVIFDGVMTPAYGWIPPQITAGAEQYRDQVEEPLKALMEGKDPKELLVEGLTELGMDPDPANLTVTISLGGADQFFRDYAEYLGNTFNTKLGVTAESDLNQWEIFDGKVQEGNFQMGYMAWGADYNDPSSMLGLFDSKNAAIATGWVNEEFDKLIADAASETDEATRLDLFKQAEQLLIEEAPVSPVVFPGSNVYRYDYYTGIGYNPFDTTGLKNGSTAGR